MTRILSKIESYFNSGENFTCCEIKKPPASRGFF